MLIAPVLTFRTIDPGADARRAYAAYADACRASFGSGATASAFDDHARWLRARVEEFPDGHVLAFAGERHVGQLEIQVPYGLTTAYVNLFWVAPDLRGQGYGRRLQEYAERYCRSWESDRIELDVSPENGRAVGFYRHLGYRFVRMNEQARLWRMAKTL